MELDTDLKKNIMDFKPSFNSSFFFRIFFCYAIIFIIVICFFSAIQASKLNDEVENRIQKELIIQTELLLENSRSYLLSIDQLEITALVDLFYRTTNNRFTVINSQGTVISDSHEDPRQMMNYLHRPEFQNALVSGTGQISRLSRTIGEDLNYYALPVYNDGVLLGFVRSAYFIEEMNKEIAVGRAEIIRDGVIVILVGILLIAITAFFQVRSVDKLAFIASDIVAGNYRRRLPEKNVLGLKKIAETINQLARKSAENISDITTDRNRLAAIFAGMVEGVIDVDENQKILHINDAAAKLLGINILESTGKAIWQEVRNNEITDALDEAIKTQAVVKTQIGLSVPKSTNSIKSIVDIYAVSLRDDLGKAIGAVIVLHDISELKSLERIRSDFVANASHELKTPITAIRGLSESVIDDKDIERETILQFMGRINSQSIRLSQLVGDLMTLSRLEDNYENENFSVINMNELVRGSIKSAEIAIEEKQQKLNVEISEDSIQAYGDPQNLSQLLDNLIDNAIKYTPENGEVTVKLSIDNGDILLQVSDTGIGISAQFQQRIFERFYRIDKARSKSLGGTGLGLSIVKNIAEKHGGKVDIKSLSGRGSTFSYRMPMINNS